MLQSNEDDPKKILQQKIASLEEQLKRYKKQYVDGILSEAHFIEQDALKVHILSINVELNSYYEQAAAK
jgi:phage shock protein A